MPTTRRQAAEKPRSTSGPPTEELPSTEKANVSPKKGSARGKGKGSAETGKKRKANEVAEKEQGEDEPPQKQPKADEAESKESSNDHSAKHMYQTGTIERGHIYFFYRPKVELEEVNSVDDVQRSHMLLVPRPPEFSTYSKEDKENEPLSQKDADQEMNLITSGSDAVPAPEPTGQTKKQFRLISIGKKTLPDPNAGGGKRSGKKETFWGVVADVGEDLKKLEEGLSGKEYETKTRGTRHQGPARLAARGAYAIVNKEARVPSDRKTHLGYHLSHPTPENFGEVQEALGIHVASSFVIQVKNPNDPITSEGRIRLSSDKKAEFPKHIMEEVFGAGGKRGREKYGLRFASLERIEMLDYENAELLFIAARSGKEGLDASLGEGRGEALKEVEEEEGKNSIEEVMKELAMDSEKIPAQPLEGEWE